MILYQMLGLRPIGSILDIHDGPPFRVHFVRYG